jgi:hypothetical protein
MRQLNYNNTVLATKPLQVIPSTAPISGVFLYHFQAEEKTKYHGRKI